jgi:hypothetical protein
MKSTIKINKNGVTKVLPAEPRKNNPSNLAPWIKRRIKTVLEKTSTGVRAMKVLD